MKTTTFNLKKYGDIDVYIHDYITHNSCLLYTSPSPRD